MRTDASDFCASIRASIRAKTKPFSPWVCQVCQHFAEKSFSGARAYKDTQHTYLTLSMAHKAFMLAQPRHQCRHALGTSRHIFHRLEGLNDDAQIHRSPKVYRCAISASGLGGMAALSTAITH